MVKSTTRLGMLLLVLLACSGLTFGQVTANVTFQADLTELIAGGFFDPGADTLYAPGAHNGWTGTPAAADIAQPDLFNPTLFLVTSPVTAMVGDTIAWKWRALPASKFGNGGWEGGDDHKFAFTGQDITLDSFAPNIGPAGSPLQNDVTVQFSVDIRSAVDTYNGKPFGSVIGVFLQGEVAPLGAWACSWMNSDTTCLKKLYDNGTNGDATAGDGIWSAQVLFPAMTPNLTEYKYAIVAAGSDTLNGGVNHLDNEAGFGTNHRTPFIPDQPGTFVMPTDLFGGIDFANPVTFSVDMSVQQELGNFDPATNLVVIRGSLNSEITGDVVADWQGNFLKLREAGGLSSSLIYANTFDVKTLGDYEFKYVIIDAADADDNTTQGGTWEDLPSGGNRMVTVPEGGVTLETVYFNDKESAGGTATATITFQADLTELIAGGFFDPGADTLYAPGAHNGWTGTPAAADIAQPDLFNPTLFLVASPVTATVGDTIAWKWRALPASKFGNGGWEGGDDHKFAFTGQDITLDSFAPNIGPAGSPLQNDVTVQFSVDVNGATDTYNDKPFGQILGVFLQGEVAPLGAWACSWMNSDTSCFKKLNDNGTNGDATAGDGIWSVQVLFPAATPNLSEYKYAIVAAGSDTLNGGVNHLDNEAGFGTNHRTPFIADQPGTFVLPTDMFGGQRPTAVEDRPSPGIPTDFVLRDNYPNPFNPSTRISFALPKNAQVTLRIYDSLGQLVKTLVEGERGAGHYDVEWNGTNNHGQHVGSGVYLYSLEAGSFKQTKKMLFVK